MFKEQDYVCTAKKVHLKSLVLPSVCGKFCHHCRYISCFLPHLPTRGFTSWHVYCFHDFGESWAIPFCIFHSDFGWTKGYQPKIQIWTPWLSCSLPCNMRQRWSFACCVNCNRNVLHPCSEIDQLAVYRHGGVVRNGSTEAASYYFTHLVSWATS